MKTHSTNYQNTFIEVAEDCPINTGNEPPTRGDKKSVAGDNVCATAQKRGVAGFVIDGIKRKPHNNEHIHNITTWNKCRR